MLKKWLVGGGGAVTTTAVGLFASGWPEHIRAHPWIVAGIALFGVLALVSGLFFLPSAVSDSPRQSIKAKRDNSGSQYSAGRDIHIHEPAKEPAPLAVEDREERQLHPSPQPDPKRVLEVLKPVFEQLTPVPGMWRAMMPGKLLGAVAWVHNPTAEEGQEGTLYRDTRASIAYRKKGELIFTIETAYWLEESGYEIDFKPGASKAIVLAVFPAGLSGHVWVSSKNERRDRVPMPRPGQVWSVSSPTYVSFAIPDEVEISIVSKNTTVRKVSFLVTRNEGSSPFYEFSLAGDKV